MIRKSFYILMSVLAVGISIYAFSYLFVDHPFINAKDSLRYNTIWSLAFHFHFLGGAVALLVGWLQFSTNFRNKYLSVHRKIGWVYVLAILVFGSTGGLYLAFHAIGGFANGLGFGMMATIWFGFTLVAFVSILRGNIDAHQKWMIRSYAVTYAAVTLRIWLPTFQAGLEQEFEQAYAAVAWFCWVPNLFVAEWIISKSNL